MTKEEYEKLLNSDYWKGFSYSLIKERNFTCEDCGRTFYNERNKLQVHHLVYRDIKPWSYKPEELIVLCEDCHKKRHGLYTQPKQTDYSSFNGDKDTMTICSSDILKDYDSFSNQNRKKKSSYKRYAILGGLILLVIWVISIIQLPHSSSPTEYKEESKETSSPYIEQNISNKNTPVVTPKGIPQKDIVIPSTVDDSYSSQGEEDLSSEDESIELSSVELIEKRQHDDAVKQAKRAGVSTEGSTVDILQRIQHADVVKQAKRAGVSTEGSTVDILQRMQHADVVKQAKRAGVSTEGSTVDILQRMQHADVVKQAKRAGVSTEGSTVEILQRIQHADVVKQAKRAGVSTEGSTIEILERIQRKEMEKFNY